MTLPNGLGRWFAARNGAAAINGLQFTAADNARRGLEPQNEVVVAGKRLARNRQFRRYNLSDSY